MPEITTRLGLKKPLGNETVSRNAYNENLDILDKMVGKQDEFMSHLADNVYQKAGGTTGTAITLIIKGTLTDGYPITFIASINNGGSATTINNKKLYKPNTTTAPTLIAGKAYAVWYDSTGDNGNGCFFIKASAEGNTIASHVLANETFSNDTDTGIKGTAPLKSGITYTPTTGDQIITAGFEDGTCKIKGESNLVANSIVSGKSIFGVSGTVEPKLNFDIFLQNLPSGYIPVSYDPYLNLMWARKSSVYSQAYGFNSAGTLISTITCAPGGSYSKLLIVTKNHMGWCNTVSAGFYLTDKNGTSILNLNNYSIDACAINSDVQRVFLKYSSGSYFYISVFDFSGTLIGTGSQLLSTQTYGMLITNNGCYDIEPGGAGTQSLWFINNSGAFLNLGGNPYILTSNLLSLFANVLN